MNIRAILSNNLATLMRDSKTLHTQAALAKKAGIAQSHIGRMLRLESDPTTEKVDAVAKAFGISASDLLDASFHVRKAPELAALSRTVNNLVSSGKLSSAEIKAMTEMLKARG